MPKRWLIIYVLLVLPYFSDAQQPNIDSLVREAMTARNDTARLIFLNTISRIYAELNPDSSLHYSELSLVLARKMRLRLDEGFALQQIGYAYLNKGNYPRSLQSLLSAIAILNDPKTEQNVLVGKFAGDDDLIYRTPSPHLQRLSAVAFTEQSLGILYFNSNNNEKSWYHYLLARQIAIESGNLAVQSVGNLLMNRAYINMKKNDSALITIKESYEQAMTSGFKRYLGSILLNMGRTYAAMGNVPLANEYYRKSIIVSEEYGYFRGVVAGSLLLADYYTGADKKDSAFLYIKNGLSTALNMDAPDLLLRSYTALSRYYHSIGNNDSTVKYQSLIINIKDSLFNDKQSQQFQNIDFDEQQRVQQIENTRKEFRAKWRMNSLLGGLFVFLLILILLWRNSLQRKKANLLLSKQKSELESTLLKLKEAQKQLVQSEKMASLGELTAGIAHEIQNPLNFVNNFSDINNELIDEAGQEMEKGNFDEAKNILDSIKENGQKITRHGQRADAIVKGMLQHSRTSSAQKELTDINKLADEYLRLSYHGLRAKDKNFNAEIETDFDNSIEKINIVPQEIGRVILNLINNGFYAVNEKMKSHELLSATGGYEPLVVVSTKRLNDKIEIKVIDNGNGIPENIVHKIFQPFFTTKPPGQGTGLGLSLSYDIVKAHGGEIKVETKESEGSEFTIELPLSKSQGQVLN